MIWYAFLLFAHVSMAVIWAKPELGEASAISGASPARSSRRGS